MFLIWMEVAYISSDSGPQFLRAFYFVQLLSTFQCNKLCSTCLSPFRGSKLIALTFSFHNHDSHIRDEESRSTRSCDIRPPNVNPHLSPESAFLLCFAYDPTFVCPNFLSVNQPHLQRCYSLIKLIFLCQISLDPYVHLFTSKITFFLLVAVLGFEHRASCFLGTCSAT